MDKEVAIIEAILFLENEPVEEKTLSRISKFPLDLVRKVLDELSHRYMESFHGIELIQIGGGWSFSPKKDLWESLKDHYGKKNEDKLSKAALETLSIIAYSQPITRAEVENIRGVGVSGIIRMLMQKNIIKEVGKKDVPGRPVQFGTTKEFLKIFQLNSIAELPKLDEVESDRFKLNG